MKILKLRKVITILTYISIAIMIISIGFNFLLPTYLLSKIDNEMDRGGSIGIIGGADGPTAVYITGQSYPYLLIILSTLFSVVGILYLFFTRKYLN